MDVVALIEAWFARIKAPAVVAGALELFKRSILGRMAGGLEMDERKAVMGIIGENAASVLAASSIVGAFDAFKHDLIVNKFLPRLKAEIETRFGDLHCSIDSGIGKPGEGIDIDSEQWKNLRLCFAFEAGGFRNCGYGVAGRSGSLSLFANRQAIATEMAEVLGESGKHNPDFWFYYQDHARDAIPDWDEIRDWDTPANLAAMSEFVNDTASEAGIRFVDPILEAIKVLRKVIDEFDVQLEP